MKALRKTAWLGALATAAIVAGAGCNAILGGGYSVGDTTGTGTDSGSGGGRDGSRGDATQQGDTASGDDGGSSDACVPDPMTKTGFENGCTTAECLPFDNTRNTHCDGGGTICPPAMPVSNPPPTDAGSDAAPPNDAAADGPSGDGGSGASDGGAPDAGPPPPPGCSTLTTGPAGGSLPSNFLYATGSTAIQPYVARVAQVLESLNIATVIYLGAGSCLGVNAMLQGYPLINNGKTATYYDPQLSGGGTVQSGTCTVDLPTKVPDLGISDVFPTTCDPQLVTQGLPSNLRDFTGPIQVMEMVVPVKSTQTSISSQAAYMVWGFGANSGVQPWTDPAFLLQRSATSGTENMIGTAIGLPPSQYVWFGVKNQTSSNVLAELTNIGKGLLEDGGTPSPPLTQANIDSTLGILASDVADSNRMVLKPLAFQDVGESCGWFPDSTQTAFDKKNVRDGHYPIWGPAHLLAYVDPNGNPVNKQVETLIEALNGENTQVLQTLDVIQFYATSHIIPQCAMHVSRASDGQDYASFAPPTSCSCYYDLEATGQVDKTQCVSCKSNADCTNAPDNATVCVLQFGIPPVGFCEPQ